MFHSNDADFEIVDDMAGYMIIYTIFRLHRGQRAYADANSVSKAFDSLFSIEDS